MLYLMRLLQSTLIFVSLFLCISCEKIDTSTQEEIKQLIRTHSIPLYFQKDSITNFLLANRIALDSLLRDKHIIGLGESTHGTHESTVLNCEIIKYLVQFKNCKAICMESYYLPSVVANDYILGRISHDDPSIVQAGTVKSAQPFKQLLEWLRQYNKSALRKVQIYGICFGGYSSLAPIVLNFIQRYDSSYYSAIANNYKQLYDFALAPVSTKNITLTYAQDWSEETPLDSIRQWTTTTQRVYSHLCLNKNTYYQKADTFTANAAIRAAKMIAQDFARPDVRDKEQDNLWTGLARKVGFSAYSRNKNIGLVYKYKDSCWAANTKEIAKELSADEKLVVWAHNAHIGRIISFNETKRLGYYLDVEYGNQYIPIGHIFYEGMFLALNEHGYSKQFHTQTPPNNSIEDIFYSALPTNPSFAVAFNTTRATQIVRHSPKLYIRAIGGIFTPTAQEFVEERPLNQFDALIYLRKTTPQKTFTMKFAP